MEDYINLFKSHSDYDKVERALATPHVSLCEDSMELHFKDYDTNGHPYVEIGGLKWATMNIGATAITDNGLYFQWADISGYTASQVGSGEGQKYFGWDDYKYTNDGGDTMAKYNETDGKTDLNTVDDAAHVYLGGSWRLPTVNEFIRLASSVNTAWTANYQSSGVAGLVCTDKDDTSKVLFFPACGNCYNDSVYDVGSSGHYWSSSLFTSNRESAHDLFFYSDHALWKSFEGRYCGCSVRGVVG